MKITYFEARGRVEPARLMLELAGAPYEYEAIPLQLWPTEGKARALECTPFGQMPLLEDGSFELCQTQAIIRYLARKLDLYGSTPEEAARMDEVAETAVEVLIDFALLFWNPKFAELRAAHREATGKKLERLDRYFTRTAADEEHWVMPGRYTMADATMFYTLETVLTAHPGLLIEFPRLYRATDAFFSADGVREYVRGDRRPRSWTVPAATFGGKPEDTHQWTD